MAVTDDLTAVASARTLGAAVIDVWSQMQYVQTVLNEALTRIAAVQATLANPAACPVSIKTEALAIKTKMVAWQADLVANHAAFLGWIPPKA